MPKSMHRFRAVGLSMLLAVVLSACGYDRSIVAVNPPAAAASGSTAYVMIVAVRDLRKFEASPGDASTPSLLNAADINDPGITSRAIGRKRGSLGAALGDIVLPPGQTVVGLVQGAARKALTDKGYAVVDSASPHYATAQPLGIDIVDFWEWLSPFGVAVRIDFKSTLNLSGDALVGANPAPVTSHVDHSAMGVFDSDWAELAQRGVDDLSAKIGERIKPSSGSH